MARTSRSEAAGAAAASALVAAVLALLELLRPYRFLQDDNRDDFLPLFVHDVRALRHGSLALFNFHQFLGIPHLAAGQTGVLYPPIYMAVAASRLLFGHFFAAIDLLVIFHLALGAAGAVLLLRRLGLSARSALFGGAMWGLNPFGVLLSVFWATPSPVVALLPWMILFSVRCLEDGAPRELATLVAARALLFFAGYPEFFLYAVLFEAAFALAAAPRRFLARWLAGFPLTAVACAPLLLPMLFQVRMSAERAAPLSYLSFSHDDGRFAHWALGLLWPFAGGTRFVGPGAHLGWLGGALALWGAAGAFAPSSPRWTRGALALAAIGVLWGCGALDRALYLAPLLNRFRFHFKLLLFAQLALSLLAAAGLERLKLSTRAWGACFALQLACLGAVAAATPPGGLIVDADRPPLEEPLAPALAQGRIASLGRRRAPPARYAPTLGFNYATLWGLRHLAGYDPLVPAGNFLEAFELNEDALLDEETARPDFGARLKTWGVRWLVVEAEELPRYSPRLKSLGAAPRFRDGSRAIYELPFARPMTFRLGDGREVPARFDVNAAAADWDDSRDGAVVFNVLRQAGFSAWIDGRPVGWKATADRQVAVPVPAGRHAVELRYEEPALNLGLALAVAAALSFWLWARTRTLARKRAAGSA